MITLACFKRHILWLADHYSFVSLDEYMVGYQLPGFDRRKLMALTFDDGYKETFDDSHSFFIENNIPATFFVTTGHLEQGELLWFNYLKSLCFEKLYRSVRINKQTFPLQTLEQCRQAWRILVELAKASENLMDFTRIMLKTYPIPPIVAAKYQGMTYEQLRKAGKSDLLEIGAHTVTHPYLNQLSRDAQEQEILDNKNTLSALLEKPIRYFAYPSGEYNYDTIDLAKSAGFEAAFAVITKHLDKASLFEIERVGVYSQSLIKLQMKALGLAKMARRFGIQVG